jgi:flagella basal body P-ring formation protein FlgA
MRQLLISLLVILGTVSAAEVAVETRAPLTAERILPAMQQALGSVIADIEIVSMSSFPAPEGEVEFLLKDLNPPTSANAPVRWRGSVHQGQEQAFSIWAMVRVKAECTRVVATETLEVGHPILPNQVREETYLGFPFGKTASVLLADVLGQAPVRTLRTGDFVFQDVIAEPVVIKNGMNVTAEFRSGRVRVTAPVVALGSGRMGETISVRNPTSKKIFGARIQNSGHVIVELGQ